MKKGRRSHGGSGAQARRRAPCVLVVIAAIVSAGLLAFMAAGCGEQRRQSQLRSLHGLYRRRPTVTSVPGPSRPRRRPRMGPATGLPMRAKSRRRVRAGIRYLSGRRPKWATGSARGRREARCHPVVSDENMFNDPPDAESQ